MHPLFQSIGSLKNWAAPVTPRDQGISHRTIDGNTPGSYEPQKIVGTKQYPIYLLQSHG